MCLSLITKRIDVPTKKDRWVWKVFRVRRGRLFHVFKRVSKPLKRGVWIKSRRITLGDYGPCYPSGFHCFTTKKGAVDYSIDGVRGDVFKVKAKGIRTFGFQESYGCVVADKIFIPKQGATNGKRRNRKD